MFEERRAFLKTTLGAGVVGVGTLLASKCSMADDQGIASENSNGVVIGQSPKKEILYKKTANWEAYYKAAY